MNRNIVITFEEVNGTNVVSLDVPHNLTTTEVERARELLQRLAERRKSMIGVWIDVNSSVIEKIKFHEAGAIEMIFENGYRYMYLNMGFEMFQSLHGSESVGEYYNTNIKGKYPCLKIE